MLTVVVGAQSTGARDFVSAFRTIVGGLVLRAPFIVEEVEPTGIHVTALVEKGEETRREVAERSTLEIVAESEKKAECLNRA